MKLEIIAAAQTEFDEAVDYYATHGSPLIAGRFIADFDDVTQLAKTYPDSGVPTSKRARMLMFRSFPYKLIYRIGADTVTVVAVAHQRRRPGYWRQR
jgi:plasmid stabilization system protein ParE